MRQLVVIGLATVLGAGTAAAPSVPDLRPQTLAAFEHYVRVTESRMEREAGGAAPFLWIDRRPRDEREAIMQRLRDGKVEVARLETRVNGKTLEAPDGMVHHWIGSVLLPGVTLERVTAFVQEYDRYPERFKPFVSRARVLRRDGPRFEVFMRTVTEKWITVVIDADYVIDYDIAATRVRTRNIASNLFEVHDAGTPRERRTPVADGRGYVWRVNNYCSFEVVREGIVEQCETISLSRDIPFGFGLILGKFARAVPRETLEFTLGHVRSGLMR
jgi:hypothetical protein